MRMKITRSVAPALAGALALTLMNLAPAQAATAKSSDQAQVTGQVTKAPAATTDISARRHWRRGNAAGFAAVAGIIGTVAAIAAAEQYRDNYGYGYYGAPYGYGASYGYAPAYRYRHWRHRHR